MSWFKKLIPSSIKNVVKRKSNIPDGVWKQCDNCQKTIYYKDLKEQLGVCANCNHHHYIGARDRINSLIDLTDRVEIEPDLESVDVLKFKDMKKYKDRLYDAAKKTGEKEALVAFQGEMDKIPVVVMAFEFKFIGGSMGRVVGEKFVSAVELAIKKRLPVICFCASGGARMQEGMLSLMQMARVSSALARLSESKCPYISVLTNPTMGGVSASLATLGDFILAEPKALIGFAGPRVIEQTVREILPEGFQHSEFLYENGAIDAVVDRRKIRGHLVSIIKKLMQNRS